MLEAGVPRWHARSSQTYDHGDQMNIIDKVFSSKPPGRGEFAQIVIRAFEAAGIAGTEYREPEFAVKIPGREATVFLHNTYSQYCKAQPSDRKAVVEKLVASFGSIPEISADFKSARQHLMPVVRDSAYFNLSQLLTRINPAREPSWEAKPLAEGLIVALAYDSEHSITSLDRKALEDWGTGFDAAFAIAKDNLWERTDPARFVGQNGVYWGEWGDSYDSSRLLFPELIYRLSLDGDPVAYVPNRDTLLVTGKNNVEGLRGLLKSGRETHFEQGHPVSPDLYLLDEGEWKTYVPQDLELRELWMATRRQRDAVDYAQQKEVLDKLPEYDDVFVAKLSLFTREGGSIFSACVWPRDVDTLLPRAEMIALVLDEESTESVMVLWDAAVPVIGHLLEQVPGLTPPRYRARDFPTEKEIGRLRSVARNPR
jgi:hypothetical protein